MSLTEGQKAPDFTLPTDGDGTLSLSDLKGQNVILYFYPKDETPGCTKEACSFNNNLPNFSKANAMVVGLSKDPVKKHNKFKEKYGLDFTLASDEECKVCNAYGSWVEKSMYGKKYMGIDRSTFLIDKNGTLRKIWRNVKVTGHVEEVLDAVKRL